MLENVMKKIKKSTRKKLRKTTRREKQYRIALLGIVILFLFVILFASNNKKIYKINDITVKENEAKVYALRLLEEYSVYDSRELSKEYSLNVTYEKYYKDETINKIKDTKLLYLCALEADIILNKEDEEEIKKNVDGIYELIGKEKLEKNKISKKIITKVITEEYYVKKLKESITDVVMEEKENDYIHYQNILCRTAKVNEDGYIVTDDEGNIEYVDSEKKAILKNIIENIYDQILLGKSFKSLASIAEDVIFEDVYNTKEGMDATARQALENISVGKYTKVYENKYGYNISFLISNSDEEYKEIMNEYNKAMKQEEIWEIEKSVLIKELIIKDKKEYDSNIEKLSLEKLLDK